MSVLINTCHALEERLLQADQECQVMLEELYRFENDIYSEPLRWIKLRLQIIALQIMHSAVSLYEEHGWKGFVFVVMTDTSFGVHWDKTKEFFRSRNSLKAGDMQLLSVDEGMAIITKLANKVEYGSFSEAIDWINQHTICIV